MEIIRGESKYDPDTVRGKVSACCGADVLWWSEKQALGWDKQSTTCRLCGKELTEQEMVDEEE